MEDCVSGTCEKKIIYFDSQGEHNTDAALDTAVACCRGSGLKKIVLASSSGATALKLKLKAGADMDVIAVTYGAGTRFTEAVEAFNKNRESLVNAGITIVRGVHALSGAERTFENTYKTGFMPLNLVSDTLRLFSQGMKVCVEVSIMAAEAGHISPAEDVVVLGGSGEGADTAVLMKPAYAANIFSLKIKEILCMPRG
jgi:uncharacterized protein